MRETGFALRFHWDPVKARTNLVKHGVSFEQASSVFRDPLATTIYDPEHSEEEERWLTRQRCEVFGPLPHLAPDRPRRREDPNHLSAASNQAGDPKLRGEPIMKEEYDFKGGERGKFYRPSASLELPVYLNEQVQAYLSGKADGKGISLNDLVNDLLRREIEIIEAVK